MAKGPLTPLDDCRSQPPAYTGLVRYCGTLLEGALGRSRRSGVLLPARLGVVREQRGDVVAGYVCPRCEYVCAGRTTVLCTDVQVACLRSVQLDLVRDQLAL